MGFTGTLREPATEQSYKDLRAQTGWNDPCHLCAAHAIEQFQHWKLIKNEYPYDKVMATHDMLVPIRHASLSELTPEEWVEFQKLKESIAQAKYQWMMEAMRAGQSIPEHFHVHLVIAK